MPFFLKRLCGRDKGVKVSVRYESLILRSGACDDPTTFAAAVENAYVSDLDLVGSSEG